jgi:hypothetical protein
LTNPTNFSYNKYMKTKRMGRPPKNKAERKSVDLRIPITEEQKAQIVQAAAAAGLDMAAWARPVLLAAASQQNAVVANGSGNR